MKHYFSETPPEVAIHDAPQTKASSDAPRKDLCFTVFSIGFSLGLLGLIGHIVGTKKQQSGSSEVVIDAGNFLALDEALEPGVDFAKIAPVFDFNELGCLPANGISRVGQQNPGEPIGGGIAENCSPADFDQFANTFHRSTCLVQEGIEYCGHFFALYFEKDQFDYLGRHFGHRHDWEHAAVWTKDGEMTHGSFSAHGDLFTRKVEDIPMQDGHLKMVYYGGLFATHALRFAFDDEEAVNEYGTFVTPTIVSWFEMEGDGVSNLEMRQKLNSFSYGSGVLPIKDGRFLNELNEGRPEDYPLFI